MTKPKRIDIFPGVKASSEHYLKGARLFLLFASTMGMVWVFLYGFLFNARLVAAIVLAGCTFGYVIFLFSFKVRSGEIIANLAITDFVVTLCLVEFFTGGINNPTDYWLMIVPVVAFFFSGINRGRYGHFS